MQKLFQISFDPHYDIDCYKRRGALNALNLIQQLDNQTDERIRKPDVVAIFTNYTDRIQSNRWIKTHKKVAFVQNDLNWSPTGSDLITKKRGVKAARYAEMLAQTRKIEKEGCIGLVDFDMKNVPKFVDALGNLQYCGFCDWSNVCTIVWYKTDDGFVVAMVNVNTESG